MDIFGPAVDIYDIMAATVLRDVDSSEKPREQHAFVVSFYPTGDVPTPRLISRIVVLGPDGHRREITDQRFTAANQDGWIHDAALNYYWYTVTVDAGPLPDGEYTIEVTLRTGVVLSQSRTQCGRAGEALVAAYLEHRDAMLRSFSPSAVNPLPAGPSGTGPRCSWTTLADLGGPDAYYVFRIAEGGSPPEVDPQRLVWWDNVFIQRARGTDEQAGRNRGSVTVGTALRPHTPYVYSIEITDANILSETNVCIVPPHQVFTTG